MNNDQRQHRQMKRDIKRAGNRTRRRDLKRELEANPAEAHFAEEGFGRHSSAPLNGNDNDATRRRDEEE